MSYKLPLDEQRKRFVSVIEYISATGEKIKNISARIGIDNYAYSKIKNGRIKNISDDVIDMLQQEYHINPGYITKGESNMFETNSSKYKCFDEFVESWDIVDYEGKKFIHFTIEENFIKYLKELYKLKTESSMTTDVQKMAEAFLKALNKDNKNENSINENSNLNEYVLIPVKDVLEIASESQKDKETYYRFLKEFNLALPVNIKVNQSEEDKKE